MGAVQNMDKLHVDRSVSLGEEGKLCRGWQSQLSQRLRTAEGEGIKDGTHLPDPSLARGRTRLHWIVLALHGRCREGGGGRFAETASADHGDGWWLWLKEGE